ncbi:hypothetical protein AB832_07150 [Flavobacteriaceae bacterium (ex Bugula neritina AB1)]|nr:hypothetical protein AB832_07150 [Flavobacteriaceae bacterium (ex Bugula neritina AB1)]
MSIKEQILKPARSKIINIDNIDIEVRELTLRTTMIAEELAENNHPEKEQKTMRTIYFIIYSCYEVGTNNRIFDESDIDCFLDSAVNNGIITRVMSVITEFNKDIDSNAKLIEKKTQI